MKLPLSVMVAVGQRRILGRVDDQPQWHAGISFGANGHATMLQPTGVLLLSQPAWDNEVATVSEWSDSSPRPPSDVMDVVMDHGTFRERPASTETPQSSSLSSPLTSLPAASSDVTASYETSMASSALLSPPSSLSIPPSSTSSGSTTSSDVMTSSSSGHSSVSTENSSSIPLSASASIVTTSTAYISIAASSSSIATVTVLSTDHAIQLASPSVSSSSIPSTSATSQGAATDRAGKVIMVTLVVIAGVAIIAALAAFLWRMCSARRQRRAERLSEVVFPWSSHSRHRHGGDGESSAASSIHAGKCDDLLGPLYQSPKPWLQPPRMPRFLRKPGSPDDDLFDPFADSSPARRFVSASAIHPPGDMYATGDDVGAHDALGRRCSLPTARSGHGHLAPPPAAYHQSGALSIDTLSNGAFTDNSLPSPSPWVSRRVNSRPNSIERLVPRSGGLVSPSSPTYVTHVRSTSLPPVDEPERRGWGAAFKAGMAAAVASVATGGREFLRRRPDPECFGDEDEDRFTRLPHRLSARRKPYDLEQGGGGMSRDEKSPLARTPSTHSSASSMREVSLTRNWTMSSHASDSSTAVAPSDNEYGTSPKFPSKRVDDEPAEPSVHKATPIPSPDLARNSLWLPARSGTQRSTVTTSSQEPDADSVSDSERNTKTLLLERRRRYLRSLSGVVHTNSIKSIVKSHKKKTGRSKTRK